MLIDLRDRVSTRAATLFLDEQRSQGKKIGYTSGCYDLIHFNHFWYFQLCRRQCDVLIVGVDSDEMVRSEKGLTRPFTSDFKRLLMVDALKPVTFAFIMGSSSDFARAAELFTPDYMFRNDDFLGREDQVWGREFAGEVVIIRDVEDHTSTTALSRSIASRLAT